MAFTEVTAKVDQSQALFRGLSLKTAGSRFAIFGLQNPKGDLGAACGIIEEFPSR
jgi:hypothetical protein